MSEEPLDRLARHWPCSVEVCFLAQGLDVSFPCVSLVPALICYSPDIFDEYTRRQYVAKAPERNPFGVDEEPAKFNEFDIFTKVGSGLHGAQGLRKNDSHICDIRFESCNNCQYGPSAIRTVFEKGCRNKRTANRHYGCVLSTAEINVMAYLTLFTAYRAVWMGRSRPHLHYTRR